MEVGIYNKGHTCDQGFHITYVIDYPETFALVTKINFIQVLLHLVANLSCSLHQMDVKITLLHGGL